MKKQIYKAIFFIIIFGIALVLISHIMNKGNTDLTIEMSKASLPMISMKVEGEKVNVLHGYTREMNGSYLRETLTPLPDNRALTIDVATFGETISHITYEVRSLDMSRLVENTEVYNYVKKDDVVTAEFNIKDLIDKNKEYMLVTILGTEDGKEIRYYTRIIQKEELHAREQLDYVLNFHNKTFDKSEAKELITYLESNDEGDNSTFNKVNIHSNFNQITWGDLNVKQIGEPQVNILEMDSATSSIKLNFQVSTKTGSETDKFNVEEYFRIRYTSDRIYLLDYERSMNQIFNPDNEVFVNDKVILGITGEDVPLTENTDGSVVVFSQENALYSFCNSENKLARLFSFYDSDNMDVRTLCGEHKIDVLSIDEAGNVRFLVYGYMNRGRHEGEVGICVYYYDNAVNAIEEEVYIPYDKSFELLKDNVELLSYINGRNDLYLFIDGSIYSIHLDDSSYSKIATGLTEDNVVVSKSNQMIAWESTQRQNSVITIMNLRTGNIKKMESEDSETYELLGFIGEDFVYGVSDRQDIIRDSSGVVTVPMNTIYIKNKQGEILKTYHQDNIYITSVEIDDNVINMKRILKQPEEGRYIMTEDDQIMNNLAEEKSQNSVTTAITEDKEKIVEISLVGMVSSKNIKLLTPKEVLFEGGRSLALSIEKTKVNRYYVYAKGKIAGIYSKAYEAVNKASEISGVVVNDSQEYIWQKGNRAIRTQINDIEGISIEEDKSSLACSLDAILLYESSPRNSSYLLSQGQTAMTILSDNIGGEVLDLTGCKLDDILYYVSQGYPVIAGVEDKSVLIVGYDEKNTIIMDPESGTIYKKGMNDSKEWFASAGNEFITYVKHE